MLADMDVDLRSDHILDKRSHFLVLELLVCLCLLLLVNKLILFKYADYSIRNILSNMIAGILSRV